MNSRKKITISIIFSIGMLMTFGLLSCKPIDVFEKSTAIPGHQWKADFSCDAEFDITDTTSLYNVYLVFRHTDAYKYNNVWINTGFQEPGKPMQYKRLNFIIGDEGNSQWKGSGMDDIWEVRELFPADSLFAGNPTKFHQPGHYQFKLNHAMYDEPLHHVLHVGVMVEKSQKDLLK